MNRALLSFILFTCSMCAHAEVWRFGNFEIEWADGWRRNGVREMVQLVAPKPEDAAVTIDVIDKEAPRSAPFGYARQELPRLASRHGKVVEALKEELLPSGATLFSVVCYDKRHDHFGIIFVHVSSSGRLAQLAIEGRGEPSALVSHYRKFARSCQWKDEQKKPPYPTASSVTPPANAGDRTAAGRGSS